MALKLTMGGAHLPAADGSTVNASAEIGVSPAQIELVSRYLTAVAGFRTSDGTIVGADRAGENGVTMRTWEDIFAEALSTILAAYLRDAQRWAATVEHPSIGELAEPVTTRTVETAAG